MNESTQLELPFKSPSHEAKGLARNLDHNTSVEAAEKVVHKLSYRMNLVYIFISRYGPLSDEKIETYFRCSCGSYRKARTELTKLGRVIHADYTFNVLGNKVKTWKISST